MASFSRRTFLGHGALGLATLGGVVPLRCAFGAPTKAVPAPINSELFSASQWGIFKVAMETGRFTAALPLPNDPSPTPMLSAIAELPYASNRIRYPMVRTDYLKNGPNSDRSQRGKGAFTRVSWDDALDLIAKEIARVTKEHGPEALYSGTGGRSTAGKLHNPQAHMERLFLLNGGCVSQYGNYRTGAAQHILPYVTGTSEVYDRPTAWPVIIQHSELVVVWGADLLPNNQTDAAVADHEVWRWFKALKEKGTRVIVIDPVRTATIDYLQAEWIAPRPQTDAALMLGMAYTLLEEKRHDSHFLENCTTGFESFQDYLTGKTDQQPKDAEWAAAITGLLPQTIRELARALSQHRTMIMAGWIMQRQQYGEQAPWMLVTLAAMLGQIGLPGGGFGFNYHDSGAGTPLSDAPALSGATAASLASIKEKGSKISRIPASRLVDMLENPGRSIDFNGKEITYPTIRLMYWAGNNPFHHHPNRNRLIRAWQIPETIIVNDPYWTPTAKFADIVLPITTQFERNDIAQGGTYSQRYIVAMHKLIDPLFEARSDLQVFSALAERLGVGPAFHENKSEMEWIKGFYEEARKQTRQQKTPMPDFDTFWNKTQVLDFSTNEQAENFVRYANFRATPALYPLPTPSGKIEITSKTLQKFGYDDCGPYPRWLEPAEWAGGANVERHPLALHIPPPTWRLNSQLNNTSFRETYEIQGREPVLIHPEDARARAIKNGDVVRLFNERGQVLAGALVSDDIRPGVVRLYAGSWYDPAEPGEPGSLCKHGDVNVLTSDRASSRLAQACSAQTAMVQIEKYETPPDVSAFSTPEGA